MTQERYGRHVRRDPHTAARWIAPLGLLVACTACIAAWFVFAQPHGAEPTDQGPATVALERESAVPTPVVKHPGNSPTARTTTASPCWSTATCSSIPNCG